MAEDPSLERSRYRIELAYATERFLAQVERLWALERERRSGPPDQAFDRHPAVAELFEQLERSVQLALGFQRFTGPKQDLTQIDERVRERRLVGTLADDPARNLLGVFEVTLETHPFERFEVGLDSAVARAQCRLFG